MSNQDNYIAKGHVPLPPKDADVLTTACDYCTVACGYKVYRWPVGKEGGSRPTQNALKSEFPHQQVMAAWASPAQHNVVSYKGKPHHVLVVPDKDATVVNVGGNHSIRGGTLAEKCYNPDNKTRERLQHPMIKVNGKLTPVSWDLATEVMADISKYIMAKYGEHAWAVKIALLPVFREHLCHHQAGHDHRRYTGVCVARQVLGHQRCHRVWTTQASTPSASSYEDWAPAMWLSCPGVDPYETKTTLFTSGSCRAARR
jgi:arsenite oxidase large subunit